MDKEPPALSKKQANRIMQPTTLSPASLHKINAFHRAGDRPIDGIDDLRHPIADILGIRDGFFLH